jgi:S-methylmethionine-dependent homocysteine/selenocysteine methylase
MAGPLADLLRRKFPLLLDGAMGTELQRRGVNTGLPLWSANALRDRQDVVLQIHRDYISAGADIITTDTFRTTRRIFTRASLQDHSRHFPSIAVELAQRARDSVPEREILVAGSMAPLEDCYRPDLVPPDDQLREEHAEHAERLATAGVDFILLETMNTIREAYAACEAAMATGKDTVVSFICDRAGNLYGGESLADAIRLLTPLHPSGFSINCVSPRFLMTALNIARGTTPLPLAVYANIGIPENERRGWEFTQEISPEDYTTYAGDWLHSGVSIVGGCCGTTPEYIAALAKALPRSHDDTTTS